MQRETETETETETEQTFVEGLDFYSDEGMMVLTRKYLLDRGTCRDSGCRHCPFSTASAASS